MNPSIRLAFLLGAASMLPAMSSPAAAGPGDKAAAHAQYKAVAAGAKELQKAHDALEKGDDKFKGHRNKAMKLIREALSELDKAVDFADSNKKPGERTNPHFNANRGKLAASQQKFPAIRSGARHVIEAGKELDQGLDRFGGHRRDALKLLNEALDELEKAVKEAK